MRKREIRLSIVSHGQDALVNELLQTIEKQCRVDQIITTVTFNTPSAISSDFVKDQFSFPINLIHNRSPKGFGANHNHAFATCRENFFCVLNPDIQLITNPFPGLLACLQDPNIGVVGPAVIDNDGVLQDSARRFPTPGRIVLRVIFRKMEYLILPKRKVFYPDWIAGMCMLFPTHIFKAIQGFDERYFMYCEDADICMRLKKNGYKTALLPTEAVVHNAQRASHNTKMHFWWHLRSLARFFVFQLSSGYK